MDEVGVYAVLAVLLGVAIVGSAVRNLVAPAGAARAWIAARSWMFRGDTAPEPSTDMLLAVRLLAVAQLVLMGVLVALVVPALRPEAIDRSPGSAADEAARLAAAVAGGPGEPRDPEVLAVALDRLTTERVTELCAADDADKFCFLLAPDAYRGRFAPAPDYASSGRVGVAPDRPSASGQAVCLTIPADRSGTADVVAGPCPD